MSPTNDAILSPNHNLHFNFTLDCSWNEFAFNPSFNWFRAPQNKIFVPKQLFFYFGDIVLVCVRGFLNSLWSGNQGHFVMVIQTKMSISRFFMEVVNSGVGSGHLIFSPPPTSNIRPTYNFALYEFFAHNFFLIHNHILLTSMESYDFEMVLFGIFEVHLVKKYFPKIATNRWRCWTNNIL